MSTRWTSKRVRVNGVPFPPSTTREPCETTTTIRCARFAASSLESGYSAAGESVAAGAAVVRCSPPQAAIASAAIAASPTARRGARGVTARHYRSAGGRELA